MSLELRLDLRPSAERNHVDIGWLNSAQTFSFSGRDHNGFGPLQIVNEDRVQPNTGFDLHPHREFEIFTYVISGEIKHGDSMSNQEIIKRGDIQLTSAGTGIRHSERCHGPNVAHFIQIWCRPSQSGLMPAYFTRDFKESEKRDRWNLLVAPVGSQGTVQKRAASGPAPIHSPVLFYVTVLSPGKATTTTLTQQRGYIHFAQTSGLLVKEEARGYITLSSDGGVNLQLTEGDGAYISNCAGSEITVENLGSNDAELLLFDLGDL